MSEGFHPLVSIVIPVYNGSNYLREAIDSALAQTYDSIEVIVVNDGSGDDGATEAIARSYGDKIRYFAKENGGVATALNRGIEEMRGEYFSWLSHDDVYFPDKVKTQVDFIGRFDLQDAVVYSDYVAIDAKGGELETIRMPFCAVGDVYYNLYLSSFVHCCTLMMRRELLAERGGFDPKYRTVQDYELFLPMSRDVPFVHQAEILVKARRHGGQGVCQTLDLHRREVMAFYNRHLPSVIDHIRRTSYRSNRAVVEALSEIAAKRFAVGYWSCLPPIWRQMRRLPRGSRMALKSVLFYAKPYLKQKFPRLYAFAARNKRFLPLPRRLSVHAEKAAGPAGDARLDFQKIYEDDLFLGGGESASGGGSTAWITRTLRQELPPLLRKFGVKSMLDIPCGDFNWMRLVDLEGIEYTGGDIVPALVERNKKEYAAAGRNFMTLDLVKGPLPKADLVFCRDCLVHLPFADVWLALRAVKDSGAQWLLTTTFTDRDANENLNGVWRPLNLCRPPFDLPEPVALLNERCIEGSGLFGDKCLGLWKLDEINTTPKTKQDEAIDRELNCMAPLVTVITPTYNRADFIVETVESVLGQNYPNLEYLVIDDGSTDDTEKRLAPYLDRLTYLRHDNMGETKTVNKGYRLARGEYVMVVNSDDPLRESKAIRMLAGALADNPDALASYPDWIRIDQHGNSLSDLRLPQYTIHNMLREFSVSLGPGMMIRRAALEDIGYRNESLRYTGDLGISFRLAIRGRLIHVPEILATHREHGGMATLTGNQRRMREEEIRLMEEALKSPLLPEELRRDSKDLWAQACRKVGRYERVLLFGDNDIHGGRFNGHDLLPHLRAKGRNADYLVLDKASRDERTFVIPAKPTNTFTRRFLHNRLFNDADLVHLHLIHNTPFEIQFLPVISSLRPVVWTLHDPYWLGGHCVHHADCMKWQTHCHDCARLDAPFAISHDTTAIEFEIKKRAIQQSQVHAIVASKWMERKAKQSPIWAGKPLHHAPFGINQELFAPPADIREVRRRLGIRPDGFVLFARTQEHFKGIDVLRQAISELDASRKYVLLCVGESGLMEKIPPHVRLVDLGWINDDRKLVDLHQACDVFLMPSEQETFGLMAIEAMSCGKPVLALDVETSAVPEVIDSPRCGLAVPRDRYAAELRRLLASPEELRERGEKSLAYARENYAAEKYVDRVLEIYRQAMEEFRPSDQAPLILQQLRKHAAPPAEASPILDPVASPIIGPIVNPILGPVLGSTRVARLKNYYRRHGLMQTTRKIIQKIRGRVFRR